MINNEMQPLMKVNVVKHTDANRGFRLFDNAVFIVRDVASEELFMERVRIAYNVFDTIVEPFMDSSMFVLANKLVLATKVCISRYFNEQSRARTDRPFIIKAEYRDSPSLFCGCSDFLRAYLYTRNTGDPFLDDDSFNPPSGGFDDFNPSSAGSGLAVNNNQPLTDRQMEMEACRIKWQLGSLQAKLMVEGGPMADANFINPDAVGTSQYSVLTAETQRPEAVLYVVADTTSLAEFLCYMFYMTPVDLKRRYEVKTGCAAPTVSTSAGDRLTQQARTCCYEESSKYNSSDTVRRAIREFLRKRHEAREMRQNGMRDTTSLADIDPVLAEFWQKESVGARASNLRKRNDTLVKNLLLLLFDKALSAIIDNGFDNANKRRRYGTNAKSIGGATVYTGILDTVGKVIVGYREGVSLSPETRTGVNTPRNVRKNMAETYVNFRFPLNQIPELQNS
jgi:hypothetical protein